MQMTRILYYDTPNDRAEWKNPRNHMFTILGGDASLAIKNPDIEVCKQENGKAWTGEYLLHFIMNCKPENRIYTHIGQWF
jgi:hypothetical protein